MGRLLYVNGQRTAGAPSNVYRLRQVKRGATGAVSLTSAPITSYSTTGATGTKTTKTFTLGLTGNAGGRNFIKALIYGKNTNATKKVTVTGSVKTVGGTAKFGSKTGVVHTASTTASNTAPLPIKVPGTVVLKGKVTAGAIKTVKCTGIKVNDLSLVMF